jgi:hypothetical protein
MYSHKVDPSSREPARALGGKIDWLDFLLASRIDAALCPTYQFIVMGPGCLLPSRCSVLLASRMFLPDVYLLRFIHRTPSKLPSLFSHTHS